MADKYTIVEVSDLSEWDEFVDDSPQGTIFSASAFMSAIDRKYALNYIYKGNEVKAGVVLTLTDDLVGIERDDLVIYNGIIFKEEDSKRDVKARYERFEITEFIINELVLKYNKIEMSLSPHFEDMRPFLWHNYHSLDESERFVVDLKYTSFLDISSLREDFSSEENRVFKQMDTIRQRNIRKAWGENVVTKIENRIPEFLDFYENLMGSQGKQVSKDKLTRMGNLIQQLLTKQKAICCVSYTENGQILYITIFCFDRKRAYFLFGAGNPQADKHYKGSICFWDTFRILARDYSIGYVDMEGVNSPKRGWFKLSFGGNIVPYFQVSLCYKNK
jgi:hypothetical protein